MRVLVACEFSGVVRDAFAALGHDAWSCDILPTEKPGQHLQCDVREILDEGGTPHKAIALKLSVSRPTISRLLGGKTWRQK